MSITRKIVVEGRTVFLVGTTPAKLKLMEAEIRTNHGAQEQQGTHRTDGTKGRVAARPAPVALQPISEAEFLERELVCRKCISFVADFPVYRCTEKKGCTKLAIKSPRELCRRGLWPSGSY